ncbi:GntR family transcriptional regulator [Bryocella elongata]|uniref:GntR family transcriptional regulator n=1 Tax=Bryocella elongata TaxID=863522 RepID=A0A1H5WLF7_9BACT|nr:GntR family transcriptional regulator [Bryocella elongata]
MNAAALYFLEAPASAARPGQLQSTLSRSRGPVRLWFAPGSDVPLYQQLTTQVELAILAGDLKAGDRLPSTRELARRYAIHPNTVSAGYRQLERTGWTEHRRGGGVYVRPQTDRPSTPKQQLDHAIAHVFRLARDLDVPFSEVRGRVAEWLAAPPPSHFLLIDPDPAAVRILQAEIAAVTRFPVISCTAADLDENAAQHLTGAVPLCRPSQERAVRAALPSGIELHTLQITSARGWLEPRLGQAAGYLIAVVSHWPTFRDTARTMLTSAGLSEDQLLFRDSTVRGWHRGLDQAAGILCDAPTAALPQLPAGPLHIIFPLIADPSLDFLRTHGEPVTSER